MNHVMIDIETFGTGRDAAVVSIGACLFDPVEGIVCSTIEESAFHQRVDLASSRHPGVIDPSTVEWWLKQDDEARASLTTGTRRPLDEVLSAFGTWLLRVSLSATRHDTKFRLWSNGPTFDEMILRDAFARHGWKMPVHFRASRCCRTIFDMATEAGWDPMSVEKNELRHDALADSVYQAHGVCAMYRHLGLGATGEDPTAHVVGDEGSTPSASTTEERA